MTTRARTTIRLHVRNLRLRLALLFFLLVIPVGFYGYHVIPYRAEVDAVTMMEPYYREKLQLEPNNKTLSDGLFSMVWQRDYLEGELWKYQFFGVLLLLGGGAAWTVTGPLADRLAGRGRDDVVPAPAEKRAVASGTSA